MEHVDYQLSIEQVNYEADVALPSYCLNRSSPQPPLDNVVDPNTEFKRSSGEKFVSPEISFGLRDVIRVLQSKNCQVKRGSFADISTEHPLYQQLHQAYTAVVKPQHNETTVAEVHSPRKCLENQSENGTASHCSPVNLVTSPSQVATILEEKEPKLVSEILNLIHSNDFSYHNRVINGTSELENCDNCLKSPILLGSKPLFQYPRDQITVTSEKGPPHLWTSSQAVDKSPSERSFNMAAPDGDPQGWGNTRYSSISNISDISLYNPEHKNVPTSPEHVAWVDRRTRDKFETASNFSACSSNMDSVCSERMDAMSMISDVSGYEEEMYRIKKLLLEPSMKHPRRQASRPLHYNKGYDVPHALTVNTSGTPDIASTHVQSFSKKKHQETVQAMEKSHELRLQEMRKLQAHAEGKLEAASIELERFAQEKRQLMGRIAALETEVKHSSDNSLAVKMTAENKELQQKVAKLDSSLKESQRQLQKRDAEALQWQEAQLAAEGVASQGRLHAEELRMELEVRAAAAEALRAKVAEQHAALQTALHDKRQAETAAAASQAECSVLQTSQAWHKEQLGRAQAARSAAQQQAAAAAAELAAKDASLESCRSQVAVLNKQVADSERQLVREKRAMLQQLEAFEADMTAREAELAHRVAGVAAATPPSPGRDVALRVTRLESVNAELAEQVESLRSQLRTAEELSGHVTLEHSQLLGRASTLKQRLAERDLQLQQAGDQLAALEEQASRLREQLRQRDSAGAELRGAVSGLQVALEAANKEKADVNKAISSLQHEFTQLTNRSARMRREIHEKDLSLSSLRADLAKVADERDALRTELHAANTKLQESSDASRKLGAELQRENEQAKSQASAAEQDKASLEREVAKLEARVDELEAQVTQQLTQNQELAVRIAELSAAKNKAERRVLKTAESLKFREEQLFTAQQGMEAAHTAARGATERGQVLAADKAALAEELERLRDELQRSDAVVRQYAALCREQAPRTGVQTRDQHTMALPAHNSADCAVQHIPDTQSTGTNFNSSVAADVKDSCTQTDTADSEVQVLVTKVAQLERQLAESPVQFHDDACSLRVEVTQLRSQLEKMELRARDSGRKHQANVGTLLRTLKEHMRGRKAAERELASTRAQLVALQGSGGEQKLNAEISELQQELQASAERLAQLKEAERRASEALIDVERERGKLEGMTSSQETLRTRVLECEQELATVKHALEVSENAKAAGESQAKQQLAELQKAVDASSKMVQDLHKQVMSERRECSSLRQQLSSARVGLDTANHLLDTRGSELSAAREQLQQQAAATEAAHADTMRAQSQLHGLQLRADTLAQELHLSKEKDPVLCDQMKRLSEHAQQKGLEAAASLQALQQAEQRWADERQTLSASLTASQDEASALRRQLDEARKMKFSLQTLAAELRGALNASLQQGKMLRTRLSALEAAQMPDLTSSLPVPSMLDETALAELLQRSAAPPPPLTNLQSCLQNLQQEVNTLQKQLEQRSMSH